MLQIRPFRLTHAPGPGLKPLSPDRRHQTLPQSCVILSLASKYPLPPTPPAAYLKLAHHRLHELLWADQHRERQLLRQRPARQLLHPVRCARRGRAWPWTWEQTPPWHNPHVLFVALPQCPSQAASKPTSQPADARMTPISRAAVRRKRPGAPVSTPPFGSALPFASSNAPPLTLPSSSGLHSSVILVSTCCAREAVGRLKPCMDD